MNLDDNRNPAYWRGRRDEAMATGDRAAELASSFHTADERRPSEADKARSEVLHNVARESYRHAHEHRSNLERLGG